MAKLKSNKAGQKYEEFVRPTGDPDVCPQCHEKGSAKKIETMVGSFYRCGDCGFSFTGGYFYDLWMKKFKNSTQPQ